jgi:hypothetical protein
VTDRSRPNALLGPLPGRARVEEGVAEGWIAPASESGLGTVVSLYVDSSALLRRYVDEPDSEAAVALLRSDPSLLTARHTPVEVRRNQHYFDSRGVARVYAMTFDGRDWELDLELVYRVG